MNPDEITRNAAQVVEDLVAGRDGIAMTQEVEAFIGLLDDSEFLCWMKGLTEAVSARAPQWRQTPPAGPWVDGRGSGYSFDGQGAHAEVTVVIHGRPGNAAVEAPDSAPKDVVDAVREAVSAQGLSNLVVSLDDWMVGPATAKDIVLDAAEDALDDALATPAERQGQRFHYAANALNARLVKNPDIQARITRIAQERHLG